MQHVSSEFEKAVRRLESIVPESPSDSEEFLEVVEASPALEDLCGATAAGFAQLDKSQRGIEARLSRIEQRLEKSLPMLMKSHASMHQRIGATSNGIRKSGELSNAQIAMKLEDLVMQGVLEPGILSRFNVNPVYALGTIPPHIAKSHGLPTVNQENALHKSGQDTLNGLTKAEIGNLILDAVNAGKLEPSVLSRFDANPRAVLATIPEDVKKSFRIPSPDAPFQKAYR